MIKIEEEKIAKMMFDIWYNSNNLKNPIVVGEYIAEKLKKAISVTQCCDKLKSEETPTFEEWVKGFYEYVGMQCWRRLTDSKACSTEDVYKIYKKEYNL